MDAELRLSAEPDGEGRARLSKRAVVDRALELADTDGVEALTIRRLAQDLGVTPMALYWHFRSKEALLEGAGRAGLGEIEVSVDPSARGGLSSGAGWSPCSACYAPIRPLPRCCSRARS